MMQWIIALSHQPTQSPRLSCVLRLSYEYVTLASLLSSIPQQKDTVLSIRIRNPTQAHIRVLLATPNATNQSSTAESHLQYS